MKATQNGTPKKLAQPELVSEPPLRLEWRTASELDDNPANWRTHPDAQREALAETIAEVGWAGACLYNERTGRLIDGHLRKAVSGKAKIPVLIGSWSEEEERKILLTLDPLAAMAEADSSLLDDLLSSVSFGGDAIAEMLSGLAEENGIDLGEEEPAEAPEAEIDRAEELLAKWKVKRGDVWRIGEHRLMCGDSTSAEDVGRLMEGAKINIAFTSPPYASQRKYDEESGFKPIPPDEYVDWWEPIQANVAQNIADDGSFFVNIKPCAEGLDTHLYVFDLVCAMVRKWGWHFATEFCWERTGVPKQVVRRFKNQFEPVYQFTFSDWKIRPKNVMHPSDDVPMSLGAGSGNTGWADRQGKGGVIPSNRRPRRKGMNSTKSLKEMQGTGADVGEVVVSGFAYPGNRLPPFTGTHTATGHTAAFPVGLPDWFIKAYTDEGDTVYEPFCGSGSTMVAAEQLVRRCFGLEISPAYCSVILERMAQMGLDTKRDKQKAKSR